MFSAITLFIGTTEVLFILGIVVVVFGTDKLPEIARSLAKGMRQLKSATNEIKHEVKKSVDQAKAVESETVEDIQSEINKVKDEVEDFSGSIKRKM